MKEDRLRIIVEENQEALSERGAALFEQKAIESVEKEGDFCVALSGGSTPRAMHRRLASRSSIRRINEMNASVIEKTMRKNEPPIIGRIEDDIFLMDMRTVAADELTEIANAIQTCLKGP